MASESSKITCTKCSAASRTAMCHGCEQSFCTKHFIDHRQELDLQMNHIEQERDVLQRNLIQNPSPHPLLERINQWEQESINEIQLAAEAARTDLQQLLDHRKDGLKKSIDKMTEELQYSQELDDYTEQDIKEWKDQLQELRKMLDSPPTISIEYDQDTQSIIRLIKVSDSRTSHSSSHISQSYENDNLIPQTIIPLTKEKFDGCFGDVALLRDGLVALCLADFNISCTSGVGRYSSGVHHIRFRIEQMSNDKYFLFSIVTALEKLTEDILNSTSVHGWMDLGRPFLMGVPYEQNSTQVIRTGDEVTLTLDCDNQWIQLKHHQTNTSTKLQVDVHQCPFPWKIVIAFSAKNDCVRILY